MRVTETLFKGVSYRVGTAERLYDAFKSSGGMAEGVDLSCTVRTDSDNYNTLTLRALGVSALFKFKFPDVEALVQFTKTIWLDTDYTDKHTAQIICNNMSAVLNERLDDL